MKTTDDNDKEYKDEEDYTTYKDDGVVDFLIICSSSCAVHGRISATKTNITNFAPFAFLRSHNKNLLVLGSRSNKNQEGDVNCFVVEFGRVVVDFGGKSVSLYSLTC